MGHEDASCDPRKILAFFAIEHDFTLLPSHDEGVLE
jgi:hypothetical protein